MKQEVELAPLLLNALEHLFDLAFDHDVERHEDRRLQRLGQRLDVLLGLFVQIGDGEVGAERTKRLGAAPCDRLIVGNADDQPLLAFERDLGLGKNRDIHDTLSRFWLGDCRFMSNPSVCCAKSSTIVMATCWDTTFVWILRLCCVG